MPTIESVEDFHARRGQHGRLPCPPWAAWETSTPTLDSVGAFQTNKQLKKLGNCCSVYPDTKTTIGSLHTLKELAKQRCSQMPPERAALFLLSLHSGTKV